MATKLLEDGCGKEAARDLALLTLYDIVILIDDSSSMRVEEVVDGEAQRIKTLKATMKEITRVYDLANSSGIKSVRFMNADRGKRNVNSEKAKSLLDDHVYNGVTRIGTELQKKVLKRFVWEPKDPKAERPMEKPLLAMVITDGAVEGEKKGLLQNVIKTCIEKLKEDAKRGKDAVAFHFSRVGNDKGAEELLRELDLNVEIGEYVDCLPMTKPLERVSDEDYKWTVLPKLLVGAIATHWNNQDEDEPEVILAGDGSNNTTTQKNYESDND